MIVSCNSRLSLFGKDYSNDENNLHEEQNEEPDDPADTEFQKYDEDTDENSSEDDTGISDEDYEECVILSIDPYSFKTQSHGLDRNTYKAAIDDTIGSLSFDDIFDINFLNPISIGVYDLFCEPDKLADLDYHDVYLILVEDYIKSTGESSRKFLNIEGSLEVLEYDPATAEIKGKISAKLVEAEFESLSSTSHIEPLVNGHCLKIENALFDTFCKPDCTGKKCGNDGCGGSCGDCGSEKTCNAGQTECVPYECEELEFGEIAIEKSFYQAFALDNMAGSNSLPDRLRISFYDGSGDYMEKLSTGVFDLSSKANSDYATCTECITLHEDLTNDSSSHKKMFFQNKGTLEITETKENSIESKGKASFRLIETTIDKHYHSIPVDGGKCYEVKNLTWDTINIETSDADESEPDAEATDSDNEEPDEDNK